jgi:hypothetical protein
MILKATCVLACLFLLGASPATAAHLTLSIERHGSKATPITIRLVPQGTVKSEPVERTAAAADATVALDVPNGQWTLEAAGSGVWHGRQFLTVAGDRSFTVPVWPAGTLRGQIQSAARRQPASVILNFEGTAKDGSPVENVVVCPIALGAFSCDMPAGVIDLRVRAEGHIGRFLWGVHIPDGGAADAGRIELREGQAIVGRVELPSRPRRDVTKTVLKLRPRGTIEGAGPLVTGSLLLPRTVTAEAKGLFHFDGVMPGEYVIRATHPAGLVSEEVNVTVREGLSATDLVAPLVLAKPSRVSVSLTPAAPPKGERWRVAIDRVVAPHAVDPVSVSLASLTGDWTSPPLAPGEYNLSIGTSFEDVWHSEQLTVASADASLTVALEGRDVSGMLFLGDRPLAASLLFHDDDGRTAKTRSDAEGAFNVVLPTGAGSQWDVSVTATEPTIDRTFQKVRVDGGRKVTLRVPNTILTGVVVDESEAPVPHALLTVVSDSVNAQPVAAADGTFAVYGLSSGLYHVAAEGAEVEADDVVVNFDEDQQSDPLKLVAHRRREVHGEVSSVYGAVAGATVVVRAFDPVPARLFPLVTGADGAFEAIVPKNARQVDVITFAPGFSMVFGRFNLTGSTISVPVSQRGGMLVLQGLSTGAFLVHAGAAVPYQMVQGHWPAQQGRTGNGDDVLRIPMMDPGDYALCLLAPAAEDAFIAAGGQAPGLQCSSGALDPLGTLTLALPHESTRQEASRLSR